MTDCGYCPFDGSDCDECKIPEFTDTTYRETCDLCGEYIMIPYPTRDHVNLVVCKECSKHRVEDFYDDYCPE